MNTTTPYLIFAAAALAALTFAGIAALNERLHARRSMGTAIRRKRMMRALMEVICTGCDTALLPVAGMRDRLLLAESIAALGDTACGLDRTPLRRIVATFGLDSLLLRRARMLHGFRRARTLALLARLPLDPRTASAMERYRRSRNRHVRFEALMVCLSADPDTAPETLAAFRDELSAREIAEITVLVRQGVLPLEWEELLTAPGRNLRSLGMALVREYFIEQAAEELSSQLDEEPDARLAAEIIRTLCALQHPLDRRAVLRRAGKLDPALRRRLARHLATEGYSLGALVPLFGDEELTRCAPFVESQKCNLACL